MIITFINKDHIEKTINIKKHNVYKVSNLLANMIKGDLLFSDKRYKRLPNDYDIIVDMVTYDINNISYCFVMISKPYKKQDHIIASASCYASFLDTVYCFEA